MTTDASKKEQKVKGGTKVKYQHFGTKSGETSTTKFYNLMQKCSESIHSNGQHGGSDLSFKDVTDKT